MDLPFHKPQVTLLMPDFFFHGTCKCHALTLFLGVYLYGCSFCVPLVASIPVPRTVPGTEQMLSNYVWMIEYILHHLPHTIWPLLQDYLTGGAVLIFSVHLNSFRLDHELFE